MATKFFLSEQVMLRLAAGYPDVAEKVDILDVIAALGQKISQMFNMTYFSAVLPNGETVPDGLMLATYTGIPVATIGTRSVSILPVMPISLPRNQGVFQISNKSDFTGEFIPMAPGQYNLVSAQPGISDFLGQIGYEVVGNQAIFHRDITIEGITTVNMRLVVMDLSKYDDYAPLPIPADMESVVVEELYKIFAPVQATPADKVNDLYNPEPKAK